MSPDESHESDGGWKHVGRSKRRAPLHNAPQEIARMMKDATSDMIQRDFEVKLRVWRQSSCRRQLVQVLDTQKPDDGWCLENAICLGSHSFSRDNFRNRQRAVMQFVAFLDAVRYLQSLQDAPILLYAQDPTYTSLDRTWLASVNVVPTALDLNSLRSSGLGPAKNRLRSASLVFEFFMEVGTEAAVDLFGSDMRLQKGGEERRAADVVGMFQQARRKLNFPTFEEDPTIFEGLKMYWKEPTDEDART
nr:hypothetical protein CFP56_36162 [Quercus suber]